MKPSSYSILADETADIAGKEQLSVGIRFFDENEKIVREEFLGFETLNAMDAETIAAAIDRSIESSKLDPLKCVGQGYDGCNTMSGHAGGVQAILRKKYPNGLFFHCASHRLNLVVNDLNSVVDVRNCIGTIKSIINFFRASVLRRKYAPQIPALCETRWSQKYKSIAIFKENFESIVAGLNTLSKEGNRETREAAVPLHAAATKAKFIMCVCLISKYSAILEPIANVLQTKTLDLFQCTERVKDIISLISEHRTNVDSVSNLLFDDATEIAEKLDVELKLPRIVQKQKHRANHPSQNVADYFKKSLVIPYLDSMQNSLKDRFSDDNLPAYALPGLHLHPYNMLKVSVEDFKSTCSNISEFYGLHLESEYELWYSLWKSKNSKENELKNLDMVDVLNEADSFFPSIEKAILTSLAQPCGTSTIERSFSTLRRVGFGLQWVKKD